MINKSGEPSPLRLRSSSGRSNYEIIVAGRLDEHWTKWLDSVAIEYDAEGNTLLTGFIPDQAALHGLLGKIRDLGLTLVSINPCNHHLAGQTQIQAGCRSSQDLESS